MDYRKKDRLTSLLWVESIKLVAVVPDPKDHRGPILAASYKPGRPDVFLESVESQWPVLYIFGFLLKVDIYYIYNIIY